ncbi:MAG: lipoyl(octanoyl) transferase LipB [Candidatus Omnitrophota bacterium]
MEFRRFDLGLIDFKEALQFQKEIFGRVKDSYFDNALILCRHYPVITVGRRAKGRNIMVPPGELQRMGIDIHDIERGGDITYHGPGRITAYPVFNLNYLKKDVHFFLRELEELAIDFLSDFRVNASRREGLTGVWIGRRKIVSIGIAIRNWITFHGMSINIKKEDLPNFRLIRPCGMDIEMTSLETESGRDIDIAGIKGILADKFKNRYLTVH